MVSYWATADELSDEEHHPLFARTIAPDSAMALGMVEWLRTKDYHNVAVIHEADAFGSSFRGAL